MGRAAVKISNRRGIYVRINNAYSEFRARWLRRCRRRYRSGGYWCFHQAIENCLHRDDVKTRELGERGGAPQIIEIARPCLLAEEISRSRFFRNAKAFSEKYFEHEVVYHFDHAIIKPPMNQRETAWHQDSAYSHRLNFAAQRLHWWLPLHDVSVEQGCMRFVRGSHKIGQLRHVSVGATSDAIKTLLPHCLTASRRRG